MVKVFVEVSKGSNLKYEHDKDTGLCILDRVLHNSQVFPYNYGYIPNTLSPDGDPLDVIVHCNYALHPGCMVEVKVVGVIKAVDESGEDDKILTVPVDKCDPYSKHINDITDINDVDIARMKDFLAKYKDGEPGKFMNVGEVMNREAAMKIIKECYKAVTDKRLGDAGIEIESTEDSL